MGDMWILPFFYMAVDQSQDPLILADCLNGCPWHRMGSELLSLNSFYWQCTLWNVINQGLGLVLLNLMIDLQKEFSGFFTLLVQKHTSLKMNVM